MSTLTEARKAAMAAGREAHLERERQRNRQEWVDFVAWVREDRRLNDELRALRERGTPADVERARLRTVTHLRDLKIPSGARPEDL